MKIEAKLRTDLSPQEQASIARELEQLAAEVAYFRMHGKRMPEPEQTMLVVTPELATAKAR